MSSQIN